MSSSTTKNYFDPKSQKTQYLLSQLTNQMKMRYYYLKKLPSMFWWGGKVKSCTHLKSEITLPFSWRTQNPYKSIYFAAQAGAGEFSTGILALIALNGRKDVSMLVVKQEAEFVKKANTLTTFTCEDGAAVIDTIQKALDTGEGHTLTMTSVGRNAHGEEVSRIRITWSFKRKRK